MSRRTSYLGVVAGAALLLAAPAAASAVTGTISKPCYSHVPTKGSEPIDITLAGGTPGAGFVIAATAPGKGLGSAGSASGNFDAAGNAVTQIKDVFPPSGSIDPIQGEALVITVKDFGAGAVDTLIGQTLITNLTMDVSSTPRSPRAHRKISASGLLFANVPVYGFVVKGTSKKVLRRISLGTGDACGYVSAKGIVAPKSFHTGSYRFYINAGPQLNKPLALYSTFRLTRRLF
jgi:hypothetical protein